MIESPLLQRLFAKTWQDGIREVLKARFDAVPRDVTRLLREVLDQRKLKRLARVAARCSTLESFREALLS